MNTEFIVKGPKSKSVWRTSPEDKLAITRHLKRNSSRIKPRRRNVVIKFQDLSLYGRWRLLQAPPASTNPLTILDGGRIDPFITYPVANVPLSSRSIIDHGEFCRSCITRSVEIVLNVWWLMWSIALSHTWPSIVPTQDNNLEYPVRAAWLEHMQRSPASFYAYQYCAVAHKALLKEGPYGLSSNERQLLELKANALHHLKQECAAVQDAAPDYLFTTIIALAAHEVHPRAFEFADRQYARSAMAKTQTFNVISNMTFVQTHMDALYALVAQRGGLKKIQGFGIAPTIAL